eukprot:5589655-Amphidinium_carterae.1
MFDAPPTNAVNIDELYPVEEVPQDLEHLEQTTFACPDCERSFGTSRGLAVHRRLSHKLVPPLALRVKTNTCIACGTQLQTRTQLLQHVANRLDCGLYTLHHSDPMSTEEYDATVSTLNKQVT